MGDGTRLHPINYNTRTYKNVFDDHRVNQTFDEHPGKYSKSVTVATGSIVDFTGSNHGGVALIVTAATTNATASLTGGGDVYIGTLATGTYEYSIARVENNDATKIVYVLKY